MDSAKARIEKQRIVKHLLLALLLPIAALAHDVPDDVTLRAFFKPSGQTMQVLVRIPLNCLIDFLFPINDDGFLEMPAANKMAPDAAEVWVSNLLNIYEGDRLLPHPQIMKTMLSRSSDASFNTYAGALAHVNGPALPDTALLTWDRGVMDVLLEAPISSDRADFRLQPRFGRLGVRVTNYIGFLPPGGGERDFVYEGDPETYRLDPAVTPSAGHFFSLGFRHLLEKSEADHLLLLVCLALLFRTAGTLVPFVLTFSVAHSAVLLSSALLPGQGPLWMPRIAGTLMALFILYAGLECAVPVTPRRFRPLVAIGSGMAFGAGFWIFLDPLIQYGGAHRVVSAISFNLGIEAGQLAALIMLSPAIAIFFKYASKDPLVQRMWTVVFAGFAAHLAWHRMTSRAFLLSDIPATWPTGAVWAAILIALAAGVILTIGRRKVTRES